MEYSKEQKQRLNKLYKECELVPGDIFDSGQYKIITRSGIEKIQYKNEIFVEYQLCHSDIDLIIIKACGKRGDVYIETFGEWNKTHTKYKKDKNGKYLIEKYGVETGNKIPVPFYSVALAEKRALSRCVLKLMNLYEYGFKGEDETMYQYGEDLADPMQIKYIEDLLQKSTYDHEFREMVENNLGNMTKTRASELINDLKNNQLDPITEGPGYNQGDIKEKLKDHE